MVAVQEESAVKGGGYQGGCKCVLREGARPEVSWLGGSLSRRTSGRDQVTSTERLLGGGPPAPEVRH